MNSVIENNFNDIGDVINNIDDSEFKNVSKKNLIKAIKSIYKTNREIALKKLESLPDLIDLAKKQLQSLHDLVNNTFKKEDELAEKEITIIENCVQHLDNIVADQDVSFSNRMEACGEIWKGVGLIKEAHDSNRKFKKEIIDKIIQITGIVLLIGLTALTGTNMLKNKLDK